MKRILFRIAAHPLPALGVVAALTVGLAFEITIVDLWRRASPR